MPLQNRVTPFGEIIATAARGLFMGNRGRLHDEHRTLCRQRTSEKRWLICKTEFRGRKRTPMTPGRYTELFFLDEAVALAAGHRPCAECRHAEYRRFKELWIAANRVRGKRTRSGAGGAIAEQIDCRLEEERLVADGSKRSFKAVCRELPDGVFVTLDSKPRDAFLLWNRALYHWTAAGYDGRRRLPATDRVNVLTPRSTVKIIAAGYVPVVHPSASGT